MLSSCFETQEQVLSELFKIVGVRTVQEFDMFGKELERNVSFELYSASWHIGKEESKIDVKDFTTSVKENVTIVSILDLQEVHDQTVGS
jgi:hypothetical protein